MSTDLDSFVHRMFGLRGRAPKRNIMPARIADVLRWNVLQAHQAVLGHKGLEVKGSDYSAKVVTKKGTGWVPVRLSLGTQAEVLLQGVGQRTQATSTDFLYVEQGGRSLNYWPQHCPDGPILIDDLEPDIKPALSLYAVWTEPMDWIRGVFDPVLLIDIAAMHSILTDHAGNMLTVVDRATYVLRCLHEIYTSASTTLEVVGFAAGGDALTAMQLRFPYLAWNGATVIDYDRITLFAEPSPTPYSKGGTQSLFGTRLELGEYPPRIPIDII